jgi:hypothetical protein
MSEPNVPSNLIELILEIQERVDRETDLLTDDEIVARLDGEWQIRRVLTVVLRKRTASMLRPWD